MIIAHLTAQLSTAVHLIMSCSHISLIQQKKQKIQPQITKVPIHTGLFICHLWNLYFTNY